MTRLVLLARIAGAHGIKGHVKLQCFASDPRNLSAYGALQTGDGRAITVSKLKAAGSFFIADLKEVKDRNAAEALGGTELFIARQQLPPPKDGEFYLFDLIGKSVSAGGEVLGEVAGVQNYGAGDLLELNHGALIPVAFVKIVGADIEVDLPENFLAPASYEDKHH
jgi:16S rRNA processing protein RimM